MKILKLLSCLLTVCLLMAAPCAMAVDETATGSITVEMRYDGKAVIGGTLIVWRVGIAQADGSFAPAEAFSGFGAFPEDLRPAELAAKLADYAAKNQISPDATAKNEAGKAVLSNLKLGLYLVTQPKAAAGFQALSPFLICVPGMENGVPVYDVNAYGKFQLERTPSPNPTPTEPTKPISSKPNPSTPRLPQTGQLKWPIPVLAFLGLALFSLGWKLMTGKELRDET